MDLTDVIKTLVDRTELHSFLSVPAPDSLNKDAFWHDEHGRPIDCNIYHPKYGCTGFEANSKDVFVTSFNPVTVYQDERTGKYIYCRNYLPMLCSGDEKHFTNKEGETVIKVDYVQSNQTRLACDVSDFEFIFRREFEKRNLGDTHELRSKLREQLPELVHELIRQHTENSTLKEGRDIGILALADSFLEYLSINVNAEASQIEPPTAGHSQPVADSPKLVFGPSQGNVNRKNDLKDSFKFYLTEEGRLLYDDIINEFHSKKASDIACLLQALIGLGLYDHRVARGGFTKYHKALLTDFPKMGSRRAFSEAVKKYDNADEYCESEIQNIGLRIKTLKENLQKNSN